MLLGQSFSSSSFLSCPQYNKPLGWIVTLASNNLLIILIYLDNHQHLSCIMNFFFFQHSGFLLMHACVHLFADFDDAYLNLAMNCFFWIKQWSG